MGMFDTIKYNGEDFQTKDLENAMIHYEIRGDGSLWEQIGHYEDVPKAERPYPNAPEDSIDSIFGCLRYKETGWINREYHGKISAIGEKNCVVFKFTDGFLVEVKEYD